MWFSTHPIIPSFRMAFDIFSSSLCTKLGLLHPTTCCLFRCICNHAINLIAIHLFHCVHGGEHTTTHDVIRNFFASIARDVGLHVMRKQTHVHSTSSFQSSWWRMDIVFTADGIHTLVNVIITNPTHANLVSWTIFFPKEWL